MSTATKVSALDHATQSAHTWVCDVAREFDTEDREFAYRVLRAWLHTLRDRLTVEAVVGFRRGRAARASSPGLRGRRIQAGGRTALSWARYAAGCTRA